MLEVLDARPSARRRRVELAGGWPTTTLPARAPRSRWRCRRTRSAHACDAFQTVRVARLTADGHDLLDRLLAPRCAARRGGATCRAWERGSARRLRCSTRRPTASRRRSWRSAACRRRPSTRLEALGWSRSPASASSAIRSPASAIAAAPEPEPGRTTADRRAAARLGDAARRWRDAGAVSGRAAARRHRQRQDRGLSASGRDACAPPGAAC